MWNTPSVFDYSVCSNQYMVRTKVTWRSVVFARAFRDCWAFPSHFLKRSWMVLWCSKISEFSSEPSWHIFFTVVQTLTVNQLIVNQHTEPIILERRQKLQKEAAVLTSYIKHNQDSIHTLMMICQRLVHRVKGQGQRQKFKRFNMQNSEQYSMYNIWMCSWYIERRTDESVKLNKF